jgi:hypothetical protein
MAPTELAVMPHNLDAEKAVLGACLVDADLIPRAAGIVAPTDFYRLAHSIAFTSIVRVHGCGADVDPLTISDDLRNAGQLDDVGGPAYLCSLTDGIPRAAHVESYAQIVKQTSVQRQWIRRLGDCQRDVRRGDVDAAGRAMRTFLEDGPTTDDGFLFEPIAELAKRMGTAPLKPLIEGLAYPGIVTLSYGLPRTYKSIAMREIVAKTAAGQVPFGLDRFRVDKPLTWLYMTEEDSAAFVIQQLDAFSGGRASKGELPIYLSVQRGITLDDPRTQDRIVREAEALQPHGVVIEPIRAVTACVDQGPRELQPFTNFARRLMRTTGAALLLGHHEVKQAAGKDTRKGNERISGGGLLSISECPLHFTRVDATHVKVTPTGFKYSADGEPIVLRLDSAGETVLRIVAEEYLPQPDQESDAARKLLSTMRRKPGLSSTKLVTDAGVRRSLGLQMLPNLAAHGRARSEQDGRAERWYVVEGDRDGE